MHNVTSFFFLLSLWLEANSHEILLHSKSYDIIGDENYNIKSDHYLKLSKKAKSKHLWVQKPLMMTI